MPGIGITVLVIFVITAIFSYNGLRNHDFFRKYVFHVGGILSGKDYKRILTSGFLHVSWGHLIANTITLFLFGSLVERQVGWAQFLLIYMGSMIGGNLFALYLHRNHYSYSAAGASGALSGTIFACIALFPGLSINLFFLPLHIPAWAFGLLYLAYNLYGVRSGRDNIGHEAHLAGGIAGMLTAICMYPPVLATNYMPILILLVPTLAIIYLIIYHPKMILVHNLFYRKSKGYLTIDDQYGIERKNKEEELDELLEKISRKGIHSLSKKEKSRLEELSK